MTAFAEYGASRLLQLAAHLESGKLGHDRFDFGTVHDPGGSPKSCGSAGCAMGELPIVFGADWRFGTHEECLDYCIAPMWKTPDNDTDFDVAEFFGIDSQEVLALFYPDDEVEWLDNRMLTADATRYEVADSIRRFVRWKFEVSGVEIEVHGCDEFPTGASLPVIVIDEAEQVESVEREAVAG